MKEIIIGLLPSIFDIVIKVGECLVKKGKNNNENKSKRLQMIQAKDSDMSYMYNGVILDNFVQMDFLKYGEKTSKRIPIKKIKNEIKRSHYYLKNIILVGNAGMGKSTALKWLFLNLNVHGFENKYLYANGFNDCEKIEEVLEKIYQSISKDTNHIVFIDGLDELKCIKGKRSELQKFIDFFDKHENDSEHVCRYVVSTRPEHFTFKKMIRSGFEKSMNNYSVFEIQKLTKKQAYKVCMSIKKLYLFDKKEGYNNFIRKWPSENKGEDFLGEKEYKKALKQYLKSTNSMSSFLRYPIFCRYAYPIICEWSKYERTCQNCTNITQSAMVEQVLRIHIKWEFHDIYKGQTESQKGKRLLEKYSEEVFVFLAKIASEMGNANYISRKRWRKLKKSQEIEVVNMAFCALQEYQGDGGKGRLCFIHRIFKEYFLARYQVLELNKRIKRNDNQKSADLAWTKSEFALMYVEQLYESSNVWAKGICEEIFKNDNSPEQKNKLETLMEYASGNKVFIYTPDIFFSVEEYLAVFPGGSFKYLGSVFDWKLLKKVYTDGVLDFRMTNVPIEYDKNVISKGPQELLVGLRAEVPNMLYLRLHFWVYMDKQYISVYSRESRNIERDRTNEDIRKNHEEHEVIFRIIDSMTFFLGIKKKFWCLFDGEFLFVYQVVPQNEKRMSELFNKNRLYDPIIYLNCYGGYKARYGNRTLDEMAFCETRSVPIVFDANELSNKDENVLERYYEIRGEIILALERKLKVISGDKRYNYKLNESIENLSFIIEGLIDLEGKLELYFMDIQLCVLYLQEKMGMMKRLAKNTIKQCEVYDHSKGIEFREFLISERKELNVMSLQKIYEYMRDYIWI